MQGHVLLLSYCRALCRIALRKTTKKELASYVPEELTNPMEWKPTLEYDSDTPLDHNLASVNTLSPVPMNNFPLSKMTQYDLSYAVMFGY